MTMTSKFALLDGLHHDGGDTCGAHLGLQIVSGDLRRRHQFPAFARIRLFVSAVEEVSDVGVLFGFGHAQVFPVQLRHDVGQDVVGMLAGKYEWNLEGLVVLGHGGEVKVLRRERPGGFLERSIGERHGHLAAAIGAEVEKDASVVVADQADGLVVRRRRW